MRAPPTEQESDGGEGWGFGGGTGRGFLASTEAGMAGASPSLGEEEEEEEEEEDEGPLLFHSGASSSVGETSSADVLPRPVVVPLPGGAKVGSRLQARALSFCTRETEQCLNRRHDTRTVRSLQVHYMNLLGQLVYIRYVNDTTLQLNKIANTQCIHSQADSERKV